jgi:membrane-bound lytic murein transglycosylase A
MSGKGGATRPGETSAPAFEAACKAALALQDKVTAAQARAFFERHFQPHRVVHDALEGLFTGYYEPVLEGSRTKEGRFQTPLLKRPPDLVTVVPETRGAAAGSLTHARRTAAGLVPFATRAEIEAGALAGQSLELLYLADPVDKFFLQVQGSGRIRLPDGSFVRVQYDGKNGHPYSSIGRYLIDKGLLAADKLSLGAIGRWLKADVDRARHVMNQNASYVFFREMPATAEGPLGAIEVPLIAGRSLAIDPGVHRLGSPIYVSVPTLKPPGYTRAFNRLMVAHDVGSAIRGPERGDIYFGSGTEAGRLAGVTKHAGRFFVLLP